MSVDLVAADSPVHTHLEHIRSLIQSRVHTQSIPAKALQDGQSKAVVHRFDEAAFNDIEIIELTDVQFGHKCCRVDKFIEYRDWILAKPNRFCVWVGDMVDAWRVGSPGAGYDNLFSPQSQLYKFGEIAAPIVHRTLGSVGGNHERRALAGGMELGELIAFMLGVPYSAGAQLVNVHFGQWRPFKIHLWHGRGASRTTGAQVNMAMGVVRNVDANLYLSGHIHNAFAVPLTHHYARDGWIEKEDAFVVSGSSFLTYEGCLDSTTEILTRNGWKNYETIEEGEALPTFNLETGTLEWQNCIKKMQYDYFGEMGHFKNKNLDMLLTPNHRVVTYNKYREIFEARRFGDMPSYAHMTWVPQAAGPLDCEEKDARISSALASVLGWFLAEGNWQKDGGAYISQSKKVNGRYVRAIQLALTKAGLKYKDHGNNEMARFYIGAEDAKILRELVPHKKLTWDLVFLPLRQARKLFSALMRGDGSFGFHPSGLPRWTWIQKSPDNRAMFQALCLRLGYASSQKLNSARVDHVTVRMTDHATWQKGPTEPTKDPVIWHPHYVGKVWCISTPNTTFIAKRNDKIFVTGNSYAEVAGYGKAALNMPVTRVFPDGRFEVVMIGNQGKPRGKAR